jgi:hypothetical protein
VKINELYARGVLCEGVDRTAQQSEMLSIYHNVRSFGMPASSSYIIILQGGPLFLPSLDLAAAAPVWMCQADESGMTRRRCGTVRFLVVERPQGIKTHQDLYAVPHSSAMVKPVHHMPRCIRFVHCPMVHLAEQSMETTDLEAIGCSKIHHVVCWTSCHVFCCVLRVASWDAYGRDGCLTSSKQS